MNKVVVVIQRRLTRYRLALFEKLRKLLSERSIELRLLVGEATQIEKEKQDVGDLTWATRVPTRYFAREMICWQPVARHLVDADMVIVTHENKLLYNLWLIFRERHFKLAFWGHGRNMQSRNPQGMRERFKRWTIRKVDWWFGYTDVSVQVLLEAGFPGDRITNLNNSIDLSTLVASKGQLQDQDVVEIKTALGITGKPVGVFLGSLHSDKRLDFLIAAFDLIRARVPHFQLLIIGDGPERHKAHRWSNEIAGVHWMGPANDSKKALYLSLGDLVLNPGQVGLAILDAMAFGLPTVTTECGIHSPEISYLRHGENGLITSDDLRVYAGTIVDLLCDRQRLDALRHGCLRDRKKHSIDDMALRFCEGIQEALAPESKSRTPTRIALVTNIPTPYRIPVLSRVARDPRVDLTVLFCAAREPNRLWQLDQFDFKSVMLRESFMRFKGRDVIHNNFDVVRHLSNLDPHVVITTGFNPTFLYAYIYARFRGCKHVAMTDGTQATERKLSRSHRWIRRIVFKHSSSFIGASDGSLELFQKQYHLPQNRLFKSALCVDNEKFARSRGRDKQFDLLFCGRLTHVKQPLFALDVAKKTAALLLRRVRILYVGTGELESELRARAQSTPEIDVQLYGFAGQAELPALYASSRIFLFPTLWDPWGVVVNEACASGLPIISTPHAGSVGEIIQAGVNGFVYEMDVEAWAHGAQRLLNDHRLYEQFSENSQRLVAGHNYDTAADGVVRAALAARDATVQCRY